MGLGRRGFVGGSLLALGACGRGAIPRVPARNANHGPEKTELEAALGRALDVAKRLGASYADARVHLRRYETLVAREAHLVSVDASETYGIGVRVVVDGAWGFASAGSVFDADAAAAAARAVAVAKANGGARRRPIALAPTAVVTGKWQTAMQIDPFLVPLADKAALILSIWPEAKKVAGVAFCTASCESQDEAKTFASSEGSLVEQRIVRVGGDYQLTAKNDAGDYVTRAHELAPMQAGWEHVSRGTFASDARRMAEECVEKLEAPSVAPGPRDLVLAPSNLWLTIHESIGHSTELDRALGYEANLAGTSFATPDKLGKLRYGGEHVTLYADKTTPGGLATCAWDDDGVPTQKWNLVERGLFVGYQTTRDQAAWIGEKASRGASYAEDHRGVPFQRMPNVSLAPSTEQRTLADLVAATDDGILITGDGSWSIDHQRYNFQFGGQTFREIKKGKLGRMLRDVAYQSNTLAFWAACDMIGDASGWELHGSLHDGKGEPGQSNPVSHGTAPARFRKIDVLNTKRSS